MKSLIDDFISKTFEYRKPSIRKAKPIVDTNVLQLIQSIEKVSNDSSDQTIVFHQEYFKELYHSWIKSSKNFKIKNLDNFHNTYVTNGVTDAFNDFYYLNKDVSVLKGEYTYHRDLGINVVDNIYQVKPYTSLIISYPFSATGNPHDMWEEIMEVCESRSIKVFVDCCFFGISKTKTLDLSRNCITHVAFSMSKTFSTGGLRTGILYTNDERLSPLQIQDKHWYTQMAGQYLHYYLMNNFSPDYIYNKYRKQQVRKCRELKIKASDTVIFGITSDERFSYFERDIINRLCLTYSLQEFKKDISVDDFQT